MLCSECVETGIWGKKLFVEEIKDWFFVRKMARFVLVLCKRNRNYGENHPANSMLTVRLNFKCLCLRITWSQMESIMMSSHTYSTDGVSFYAIKSIIFCAARF